MLGASVGNDTDTLWSGPVLRMTSGSARPLTAELRVSRKLLQRHEARRLIKGVSYGTFAPGPGGVQFPALDRVAADFEAIAALGANTIRCYTPPPMAVLDEAARHGLHAFVGIPWSQHTAFLDTRHVEREIRASVRQCVRQLASHPAMLLFSLGNEIPPTVVRWYGRRRIERFLRELYEEAKDVAPETLLTYVNYPPTEYLELGFFDVCAFNVFLHDEARLAAYVARLHHMAFPRPLLLAEMGADSTRHGVDQQAALVAMQLRVAFRGGVSGAVVFSWTDDWWRGGRQVDDWAFGLVDAGRRQKPAYRSVQEVFQSAPFPEDERATWPRISVAVCAYNAAATLEECLASIEALHYPDFEIILVNDGSTDDTGAIVARHPRVRVIDIPNGGLAAARNVAWQQATGTIIAYTDADVRVDPDWLTHLVQPFLASDVAAAGGPNVVPPDDPWLAQAVARAPGGPTHVLLDDRLAEHVPGCNCAFRRDALISLGGFNPAFVRAGDDVDICWRILARGWTIGFSPSALVWHRHRPGVGAYLRQQAGYGEGEEWLVQAHPERFVGGRPTWQGVIYSPLPFIQSLSSARVNAGPFGTAAFPSVYRIDAHPFAYMPHSDRWQMVWMTLLTASALASIAGSPLALALFMAGTVTVLATLIRCVTYSMRSEVEGLAPIGRLSPRSSRVVYRAMIAALHFLQPLARMYGHARGALARPRQMHSTPATRIPSARPTASGLVNAAGLMLGRTLTRVFWSQAWVDERPQLAAIADHLRRQRRIRHIELDSGWWEDRDVMIVDRMLLRFDMRVLVEDLGDAGCLYRFSVQWKRSGTVLAGLLAIPATMGLLHAATGTGWWTGAAVCILAAGTIVLAHIAASWRVIAEVLTTVTAESGMRALAPAGTQGQSRD